MGLLIAVLEQDDVVGGSAEERLVALGLTIVELGLMVVGTTEVLVTGAKAVFVRYFVMVFTGIELTVDVFFGVHFLTEGVLLMGVIVAALHFHICTSPSARSWDIWMIVCWVVR